MLDTKFWDAYFRVYDSLNFLLPYRELLDTLVKELELKPDDIVLDVGSGTGNVMMRIAVACKDVTGIDYSSEGIKIHKTKFADAKVIVHDITKKFPFADKSFSKIVSNNVLYTLNAGQQKEVALEMFRVMKPGGKLVVSNVKKEYSPFKIYFAHIKKSVGAYGLIATIITGAFMAVANLKMLYFNWKIRKSGINNNYCFLSPEAQKYLLQTAGFINISEPKYVYASQAIMHHAYKL